MGAAGAGFLGFAAPYGAQHADARCSMYNGKLTRRNDVTASPAAARTLNFWAPGAPASCELASAASAPETAP